VSWRACGNRIVERVQRGAFSTSHHTRSSNAALTETDVDMTIDTARQAFPIVRKR
jgi:glutamate-1-semialdehyde 2,1-aminomutase